MAVSCGDAATTITLTYDASVASALSGLSDHSIDVWLEDYHTFGSDSKIVLLGTVQYPNTTLTIQWPDKVNGFPLSWLANNTLYNGPANLIHQVTGAVTVVLYAEARAMPTINGYDLSGTLSTQNKFGIQCCPLSVVGCPCNPTSEPCTTTLTCDSGTSKCKVACVASGNAVGCPCSTSCDVGLVCESNACANDPSRMTGQGIDIVAYPSGSVSCGDLPFTLTWAYEDNAISYFSAPLRTDAEKQIEVHLLLHSTLSADQDLALLGVVTYPQNTFVVQFPDATSGFPQSFLDAGLDNYGSSATVSIRLEVPSNPSLSSKPALLQTNPLEPTFTISCCPTGGFGCSCASDNCQAPLICAPFTADVKNLLSLPPAVVANLASGSQICVPPSDCPAGTTGCACVNATVSPSPCNTGLQCNPQTQNCETAPTFTGQGVTITMFPQDYVISCGDPASSLQWMVTNTSWFSTLHSDDSLQIELLLWNPFGVDTDIAELAVVSSSVSSLSLSWPSPFPPSWTSPFAGAQLSNDGTQYIVSIQVRSLFYPDQLTSYSGSVFSIDPKFVISCCPAGYLNCNCTATSTCNSGLTCSGSTCTIDTSLQGNLGGVCVGGNNGIGGTCNSPYTCDATGVCQNGLLGAACVPSSPYYLSVCAGQSTPVLGCNSTGVCAPCNPGDLDCSCDSTTACQTPVNSVPVQCIDGRCIGVPPSQNTGCLGCPCGTGNTCESGLMCASGTCATSACTPGTLGCACDAQSSCTGAVCSGGQCVALATSKTLTQHTAVTTHAPPTTMAGCQPCTTPTCASPMVAVKGKTPNSCGCYTYACVSQASVVPTPPTTRTTIGSASKHPAGAAALRVSVLVVLALIAIML